MEPDYNDILRSCGGRLTINDAKLLYESACEIKAKDILEIGAMDGCSSMVLGHVARENDGHLWSIEPAPKQRWRANIDRLGLEPYVTLIFGESPWVSLSKLPSFVDYFMIDGDHRPVRIITDWQYGQRILRPGGRVAFHDWTGAKGVGLWVQKAVGIILEEYDLNEIGRVESGDRGLIVFEKP